MDWQMVVDIIRIMVGVAASGLAVIVFRNGVLQSVEDKRTNQTDPRRMMPHPATYTAYSLALVVIAEDRFQRIGDPWNYALLLNALAIGLGVWGMVERTRRHRAVREANRRDDL